MFGMLAAAVSLFHPLTEADFSADLFLVANNPTSLQGLDWLDKPREGETVERLLRPTLAALTAQKANFVVLDGTDCSIFPKSDRNIWYTERCYEGYDSMTESVTDSKGVTKKRVLARSETTSTSSGNVMARPFRKGYGYISQIFVYFGMADNTRCAIFQDLNSYDTVLTSGQQQDRDNLGKTLLLSGDSIQESKRILREHSYDFQGICISKWGLPDPSLPNFIAFPPAGVAAHYKLAREGGKWSVRLVEYLRESS